MNKGGNHYIVAANRLKGCPISRLRLDKESSMSSDRPEQMYLQATG